MRLMMFRTVRVAVLALSAIVAVPVLPAMVPAAQARSAPDSFADLAQRLLPGVVNVAGAQRARP
jgi:serine protease Do